MNNKYHASWTMFGRGYRTDLDETDPETQQLAQRIRHEIALEFSRDDLKQSFGNSGESDGNSGDGNEVKDVESNKKNDQPSSQTNPTSMPPQELISDPFISSTPRGNQNNTIPTVDERKSAFPLGNAPANTAATNTSSAYATQAVHFTRPEAPKPAAQADNAPYHEDRYQRDQRSGSRFLGSRAAAVTTGMPDKATGLVEQLDGKSKHSKGKEGKL
jgi:hypothetical protein